MQALPVPSTPQSANWKKLAVVGLLAVVLAAFVYFDLTRFLSLESLKTHRARLLEVTETHYLGAVTLFIATYIVVTAASLPGATILTLAGGFLFGVGPGAVYVNIGATAGATLAFLAARYVLRDWVEATFGGRLTAVQEGFNRNAFHYLLTLRLIPAFPFFLVNLLSGLTRIGLGPYVAATALGIVPGSLVYAYAGRQLGSLDSIREIASPPVLLAFTLLGLLALTPVVYRQALARFSRGEREP